ncbi:7677_t:CDS:1, partial [Gigaspora rosea]
MGRVGLPGSLGLLSLCLFCILSLGLVMINIIGCCCFYPNIACWGE